MEKPFQLRWATGKEARIHSEGEWQLRFRNGAAHDFAKGRLKLKEWLSFKNVPSDETLYTFHKQRRVSSVLANLIAAGIPKEEIQVEKDYTPSLFGNATQSTRRRPGKL